MNLTELVAAEPPAIGGIVMSEAVVRILSHDLKNPLAGIAGALQLLGESDDAGVPRDVLLGEVLERVADLSRTLDDLVSLGRPLDLMRSSMSLPHFVRDVIQALIVTRGWHGIDVVVDGDDASVHTDPECVERIIGHLVQNAVEAMEGHGRVRVRVAQEPSSCSLHIFDDGPGFPRDHLHRVFEPRFTTKPAHPGLGLAVAAYLAAELGGGVRLGTPRSGAEVIFTLPA